MPTTGPAYFDSVTEVDTGYVWSNTTNTLTEADNAFTEDLIGGRIEDIQAIIFHTAQINPYGFIIGFRFANDDFNIRKLLLNVFEPCTIIDGNTDLAERLLHKHITTTIKKMTMISTTEMVTT